MSTLRPRLVRLAENVQPAAPEKVGETRFVRAATAFGYRDLLEVALAVSVEYPNVGRRIIHRPCPIGPLAHFCAEYIQIAVDVAQAVAVDEVLAEQRMARP